VSKQAAALKLAFRLAGLNLRNSNLHLGRQCADCRSEQVSSRGEGVRKNIVLIDFENIQPSSLEALTHDHFRVLVFVGANQTRVPFEIAAAIQRMGESAEYIKISGNGPNALDFHIAYYIGKLASQEPGAYFHIISKDTGFDPLVQHLKRKKIYSSRSTSIADIPLVKASAIRSPTERAALFITKLEQPKVTKPRTLKTLSSAVATHFQKQLSDEDIVAVVSAMEASGFLSIEGGKIVYTANAQG
jgi:hypothetical protein